MSLFLVYPGQLSETVLLTDVLKEQHALNIKSVEDLIAKRKKEGVPLDDNTDFDKVKEIKEKIGKAESSSELAELSKQLLEQTLGNEITVPKPIELPEELNGIKIQFKMISSADYRMHLAEMSALWSKRRECELLGDKIGAQTALNEIDIMCGKLICSVVSKLEGIEGLKDIPESIEALEGAGILGFIYNAARHFLGLPRPKALRCGLPQQ